MGNSPITSPSIVMGLKYSHYLRCCHRSVVPGQQRERATTEYNGDLHGAARDTAPEPKSCTTSTMRRMVICRALRGTQPRVKILCDEHNALYGDLHTTTGDMDTAPRGQILISVFIHLIYLADVG